MQFFRNTLNSVKHFRISVEDLSSLEKAKVEPTLAVHEEGGTVFLQENVTINLVHFISEDFKLKIRIPEEYLSWHQIQVACD